LPLAVKITAKPELEFAETLIGPGIDESPKLLKVIVCDCLLTVNVFVTVVEVYVSFEGTVAVNVQVPYLTELTVSFEYVHAPAGFPVAVIVTAPPDVAVAVSAKVPPMDWDGIVLGLNVMLFARSELTTGRTVTPADAGDKAPKPTPLVAATFAV